MLHELLRNGHLELLCRLLVCTDVAIPIDVAIAIGGAVAIEYAYGLWPDTMWCLSIFNIGSEFEFVAKTNCRSLIRGGSEMPSIPQYEFKSLTVNTHIHELHRSITYSSV